MKDFFVSFNDMVFYYLKELLEDVSSNLFKLLCSFLVLLSKLISFY